MLEYKLTVVDRTPLQPDGAKHPVTIEREVYTIGYFKTERALEQWAERNVGEIGKE